MDHTALAKIKQSRGFIESPTGGFVRSNDWAEKRKLHTAKVRRELSERLSQVEARLGLQYEVLPLYERVRLAIRISWHLIRGGKLDSILDIIYG